MTKKYNIGAIRDAKWVMLSAPGCLWVSGAFTERREQELVSIGVLVPIPGRKRAFTVAHIANIDSLPVRTSTRIRKGA